MNEQNPKPTTPTNSCVSDSPYTDIIYDDGEGDTIVRPIPPERLARAIAERDRIQACLAAWKAQKAGDRP
jgi:hypothetical protein